MNGIFDETKLLSFEEVATVLGIKKSTIIKWVSMKRIPFIKFSNGGSGQKSIVKFNGKRLNQWLEELSQEPEDKASKLTKRHKGKQASKQTIDRFNHFASTV